LVLLLFAVAYGYYTISGSAINYHPHNGRNGVPGANRPDAIHDFAAREAYAADMRTATRTARDEARYSVHAPAPKRVD